MTVFLFRKYPRGHGRTQGRPAGRPYKNGVGMGEKSQTGTPIRQAQGRLLFGHVKGTSKNSIFSRPNKFDRATLVFYGSLAIFRGCLNL